MGFLQFQNIFGIIFEGNRGNILSFKNDGAKFRLST